MKTVCKAQKNGLEQSYSLFLAPKASLTESIGRGQGPFLFNSSEENTAMGTEDFLVWRFLEKRTFGCGG